MEPRWGSVRVKLSGMDAMAGRVHVAGISDEDISKVREASDIVSVFADRIPLRQKGRTYWCCCPFHDERTPSCQIDPSTQLFYCFGCHEGGDVFTYIMKTEDIDFPDAVRKLADRAGIEIHETGKGAVSRSYKTRLKEVCKEACEFYHLQLMRLKSPEADAARAYLGSRGLGGEVPKRWTLGFAPGRGALMAHLRGKGYSVKEMVDANVVTQYEGRSPRDRFFNRIMFPIFDDAGECIAFGGRVVGQGEPKYLNSQETPLFHKSSVLYGLDRAKAAMTSTGVALVVEGYTDVIALHEAGMTNAVATLGTALTKQHIRILSRHAGSKIVYLFDGDEAGQRAADRALGFIGETLTPEAGRKRIELCACTLPDDLDPADFVAQRGIDALREQLDAAPPLISYGIDRRIRNHDTSTAEGRAAAFAEAIAVLAPIKDSLLAKDYAVQIAGRLHVRENDALERLALLQVPREPQEEGWRSAGAGGRANAGGRAGSGNSRPAPQEAGAAGSYDEYAGYVPDDYLPADAGPAAGQQPAPAVQLSESERNRRRFEEVFVGICARHPELAGAYAEVLASTQWHAPQTSQLAERLLDIVAEQPNATAAEVVGLLTMEFPGSTRVFVAEQADTQDPETYAAFLAEELAIGDLDDAVVAYRAQLRNPGSMSSEEYDLLFQTVSALQRELVSRRIEHARSML